MLGGGVHAGDGLRGHADADAPTRPCARGDALQGVVLLRQSLFAKATADIGYGGRADGVWCILAATLQREAVQLLRISGEGRATDQHGLSAKNHVIIF